MALATVRFFSDRHEPESREFSGARIDEPKGVTKPERTGADKMFSFLGDSL
jgi:hypothetical protein